MHVQTAGAVTPIDSSLFRQRERAFSSLEVHVVMKDRRSWPLNRGPPLPVSDRRPTAVGRYRSLFPITVLYFPQPFSIFPVAVLYFPKTVFYFPHNSYKPLMTVSR